MEMPAALKAALEQHVSGMEFGCLSQAARELSEHYRLAGGQGSRGVTDETAAASYALARMPATYGAVSSALQYALECYDGAVRTLQDAGAGTGAASWAADSLLDLEAITCIEREESMRRLGKRLMASGSEALRRADWVTRDLTRMETLPRADLVIAAYVLGEMRPAGRVKTAEKLWDAANGLLLIVGPGTPESYAQMMGVRSALLGEGAHLIAPCPHGGVCALGENDWCHFTCRVSRSRMHRQLKGGDAPFEDEKFCYLAFSKNPARRAAARVLRHPGLGSGFVKLRVCTEDEIRDTTVTRKNQDLYKQARKAKCGDRLELPATK